jgi:hypothetical protein
MRDNFAVLLLSCDKYSDMWKPFCEQFRKYFPQGKWPIYIGSNKIACTEPGTISILSGDDLDWSTSYKRILTQIKERKIFVIIEDFLLASSVDEKLFSAAVDFLFDNDANHISYMPVPKPDSITSNPHIGQYERGAPYRATVIGFWDREYLASLLLAGESPWNFEILGSYRTSYSDGFYCMTSPLCDFRNMIEKGWWIPESVEWARSSGIQLDLDKRPMQEGASHWVSRLQMIYFKWILKVPWQRRVRLMNTLRKALISY